MTDPNPPDDAPPTPSPPPKIDGWPWSQIGFLTFNIGLLISASKDLLLLAGLDFPEFAGTISGLLFVLGLFILASHFVPLWTSKYVIDKAPFFPRLRWINIGMFGGAVTMMLLSLIIPGIHAGRKAAEKQAADESETNIDTWQTVRSERSPVTVQLPSHWVEAPDPDQGRNDVVRIDPVNDFALIVFSIPREDVTYPNVNAWADAALRDVETDFQDPVFVEKTFLAKPGPPTVGVVLECTIEKTRYVFLMRYIEMPDRFVSVRLTARPSGFREHEETLRRIAQSVRSE